jgi:hypothetical protein
MLVSNLILHVDMNYSRSDAGIALQMMEESRMQHSYYEDQMQILRMRNFYNENQLKLSMMKFK